VRGFHLGGGQGLPGAQRIEAPQDEHDGHEKNQGPAPQAGLRRTVPVDAE